MLALPSRTGRALLCLSCCVHTAQAEWKALYGSGSGERGLFSRSAAKRQAATSGRRDAGVEFGTNPCW